jgi:DNA-binding response OmpR family regulator/HPt (histidine-containing phosphotransfer) domain-containing protein
MMAPEQPEDSSRRYKILYISSVAKTRESMAKICRFLNYDISFISTCEDLNTSNISCDIAIIGTDIVDRCKPSFVENIRRHFTKPLVVCLTNAESEDLLMRNESLEDAYYLVVPCSPLELKGLINARLHSSQSQVEQQLCRISSITEKPLLQATLRLISDDLVKLVQFRSKKLGEEHSCSGSLAGVLDHIKMLSTILEGVRDIEDLPSSASTLSRSDIETLIHLMSQRAAGLGLEYDVECLTELPNNITHRGRGVLTLLTLLLDMSLENTSSGRIFLQISFNSETKHLECTLSDTGGSVYSAEISLLQERYPTFFRLHQLRRDIVEQLSIQNEGTLRFFSFPGVGNQIKLKLPVTAADGQGSFDTVAPLPLVVDEAKWRSKYTFSIVGCVRDMATYLALSQLLSQKVSQAFVLTSHKAVMKIATSREPKIVFLGLDHPGLNGVKIAKQLRQSGFQGEIVALSFDETVVWEKISNESNEPFSSIIRTFEELQSYLRDATSTWHQHLAVQADHNTLQRDVTRDPLLPANPSLLPEDQLQYELTLSFFSELNQKLPTIKEIVTQKGSYKSAADLTNQLAGAALMASLSNLGDVLMQLEHALRESRAEDALTSIIEIEQIHHQPLLQMSAPSHEGTNSMFETILSELPLDSEDLRLLVLGFAANLPEVMIQMQDALGRQDWDRLRSLCHEYAGASSLYGYSSLSDELKALEDYVKEKSYVPAQDKLARIGELSSKIARGANPSREP